MPKEAVDSLTKLGIFGPSPNNIIKVTVNDNKKSAKTIIDNLNQPFGMIYFQDHLFVANTDSIMRFDYQKETLSLLGEKIIELPFGPSNNHWTRNIILNAEKDKILVAVGSGTNVNEEGTDTKDRAAIWEINLDGTDKRLYATGLRNPVGMSYDPTSGKLWATVNERDGLGENVPPDYLTEVIDGEFYGWPFVYFGIYPDPIQSKINPKKVVDAQLNARVPDMALGAHTVPLGLLFHSGKNIDQKYKNGAFVARRGGVSRSILSGYDVVFIPFKGYPTGEIETFISGFVADQYRGEIYGRPVGLVEMNDGTILLSDDASGKIWKISYKQN
jgi:glucose/arabinose dehydrogenase